MKRCIRSSRDLVNKFGKDYLFEIKQRIYKAKSIVQKDLATQGRVDIYSTDWDDWYPTVNVTDDLIQLVVEVYPPADKSSVYIIPKDAPEYVHVSFDASVRDIAEIAEMYIRKYAVHVSSSEYASYIDHHFSRYVRTIDNKLAEVCRLYSTDISFSVPDTRQYKTVLDLCDSRHVYIDSQWFTLSYIGDASAVTDPRSTNPRYHYGTYIFMLSDGREVVGPLSITHECINVDTQSPSDAANAIYRDVVKYLDEVIEMLDQS